MLRPPMAVNLSLKKNLCCVSTRLSSTVIKAKSSKVSHQHEMLFTEGLHHVCKMMERQNGNLSPQHVILSMKLVRQLLIPPELSRVQTPPYRDGQNSEDLTQFCQTTAHLLKFMSPKQLNDFFTLCLRFSFPFESKIFHQLIDTIRIKLNRFDHYELCRLDVLLKSLSNYDANIDVSMIRLSLPIFFERRSFTNSTSDNYAITKMVSMAEFAIYSGSGFKTINTILSKLYERRMELYDTLLYRLLMTFLTLDYIARNSPEHSHVDVETKNLFTQFVTEKMVDTDCETEIRRLMETKLIPRGTRIFEGKFIEYAERLYLKIFASLDVSSMERVLDNFRRLGRVIPGLLDEYHKFILQNPESAQLIQPVSLIANLASIEEFEPSAGWSDISQLVLDQFSSVKSTMKLGALCKLAAQFAYLGEFPSEVYEEFTRRINSEGLALLNSANLFHLLCINVGLNSADVLTPECFTFKETLEPHVEKIIADVNDRWKDNELAAASEILPLLRIPNGGDDYVQPLVWTKDGLPIHNLLVMREGNYPVKLPSSSRLMFFEQIKQPPASTPLSVLPLDRFRQTRDNFTFRSCDFQMNMLQKKGIKVVTVNVTHLSSLNQYEKIPFLMSQITKKLNEINQ